jgi:uncharacterized membrane protein
MNWKRRLPLVAAFAATIGTHTALGMGQGYGVAAALASVQAVACGAMVAQGGRRWRWAGAAVAAALLAALWIGRSVSPRDGLLAVAGVSHAMIYLALLAWFAASLRPGRVALVTWLASRLNPGFHPGMVPYTRAVTWAWCAVFAAQLLVSLLLLMLAPGAWAAFVTTLHVPLVIAAGLAEFAVRRWRWRHDGYTGLRETVAGTRRLFSGQRG